MSILKKFQIPSDWFNFFFAIFTVMAYNGVFFRQLWEVRNGWGVRIGTAVVLVLALNIVYNLLFYRRTTKPLAVLLTLINAFVLYFMVNYNAVIDKVMLLNVIQTDVYEVEDLFGGTSLYYIMLFGVLPSLLIILLPLNYDSFSWKKRLVNISGSVLLAGAVIGIGGKTSEALLRNKPIRYALVPSNYIGSTISVIKMQKKNSSHPFVKIAEDASRTDYWHNNGKKNLFIFIVGETARADSFSLNGYERDTAAPLKPYLEELINFSNVTSCGTSTAVSVPCMFSKDGRRNFKPGSEEYTENFLDVLERLDFKVFWRENNTGCKNNCDRVEIEDFCTKKTCFDEILLTNFSEKIRQSGKDVFVVMHQTGSHGPAYFEHYPKEAERWRPVCKTENLSRCSTEELMNVYDNTVYYTSIFLNKVIKKLSSLSDEYNVALIYASDHGESLGENGIYLHAQPYETAPDFQKEIPMLVWLPDASADAFGIDRGCLQKASAKPHSHDNLFHSVLGLAGIETADYDPALDIFSGCRK